MSNVCNANCNLRIMQLESDISGYLKLIEQLQLETEKLESHNKELEKEVGYDTWFEGEPPKVNRDEWFIAVLKDGRKAVLTALPEEYSHDYKTADETYYTKDWIKKWRQFPESNYISNASVKITALESRNAELESSYKNLASGIEMRLKLRDDAHESKITQLSSALEIARKALEWYEFQFPKSKGHSGFAHEAITSIKSITAANGEEVEK